MVLLDKTYGDMNSSDADVDFAHLEEAADRLQPEDFLSSSRPVSSKSLQHLKSLYDFAKSTENDSSSSSTLQPSLPLIDHGKKRKKKLLYSRTEVPLPNLIVQDFDENQIWEEIQLQNSLIYDALVSSISKVLALSNKPQSNLEDDDDSDDENILQELQRDDHLGANIEDEDDLSDFFESDDKWRKQTKTKAQQKSYSKSVVDDKFFNLAQMTEFVDKMDAEEVESQGKNKTQDESSDEEEEDPDPEEDVDYFGADAEEEEENVDYYYKDFFDPPLNSEVTSDKKDKSELAMTVTNKKSVKFNLKDEENELEDDDEDSNAEEGSDEDGEEVNSSMLLDDPQNKDETILSNFEKKRRKIEENIKLMEDEALQPKSWHLTGEVTAQTRPENSLLEEHLLYDHLLRQAPEITMKTTQKLEDIIKQRIKDQAWDDVIRKAKPIEGASEYKKRLVLDAEKSKMSLAEIYEKEYIEKQKKDEGDAEDEKEPEEHKVIQKAMSALFAKLDALSHFHYTPKVPAPDIQTVTNAPTITMEEVALTAFSDATLLAPQEIQEPSKGEVKAKEERSTTDRKRERRLKKKKQHLKRLAQEEKARAKGLGLRNIKLAETFVRKSKKSTADEGYHNSKELKSSKAFFAKLQEKVNNHIDKVAKRKKGSSDPKLISAKKFKL